MSIQEKKAFRKALKSSKVVFVGEGCVAAKGSLIRRVFNRTKSTVVVVKKIRAGETLFPEKLAMANEMLSKTRFNDPILRKLFE